MTVNSGLSVSCKEGKCNRETPRNSRSEAYFLMVGADYSEINSDNRGLVSKYLSRRLLNVSIVPESTTFDGKPFQIFIMRLKKKCLASFVLNRFPITLKPLFLVKFDRSVIIKLSGFIFVNPLKFLKSVIRSPRNRRLERVNKFSSLSRSSYGLLRNLGTILVNRRCILSNFSMSFL